MAVLLVVVTVPGALAVRGPLPPRGHAWRCTAVPLALLLAVTLLGRSMKANVEQRSHRLLSQLLLLLLLPALPDGAVLLLLLQPSAALVAS